MQISRAIAFQTLAVCTGLVLITIVTMFSWSRYEQAQDDAGRNAQALQDFRLVEETTKSWLLNNDLIFASDQNFLIISTRRQGELMIDVADGLLKTPLGAHASDALKAIIGLVERNGSALSGRQYLGDGSDAADSLDLWDLRSTAVSENVEMAREQLHAAADLRAETLTQERDFLLQLCVVSYCLFGMLVVGLWRWLTRYLAKPLSDLTKLADAALHTEKSLALKIAGPTEVETLTRSINAYTQLREQLTSERAGELEEQKRTLESEVCKRIEAEQQAQASAHKAQEASEAKSQFLANMSHEIRTPLNGIIGSAEILKLDTSPDKTGWCLQNIQKSGEHLLALINQILDFSKIEAGQLEVDYHPFVLDELLGELKSIFAARSMDKNIEFLFDIAPDMPASLEGDSLRIRQVLTNLLANAFTYTDKGSVLLRCVCVAKPQSRKRTLIWEIQDSGKGIPADQQAHIFDSFRQAESGTTRTYGGTGLGLTISRQLVELMGGHMEVESEPGSGSTFRCSMDVFASPQQSESRSSRTGDALLFIHNPDAREPLARLLQFWGWSVNCLPAGQVADGTAAELLAPGITLFVDHVAQPHSALLLATARERGVDRIILDSAPAVGCASAEQASRERVLGSALIPGELFAALKALRSQRPEDPSPAQEVVELSGHVLLVEDNPVNQVVTQQLLELMGLSVSIAEDGEVAIEKSRCEKPDLILMDWHMPRMDGICATERIREFERAERLRRTPIIMFTADAQEENEKICRQAGANELLAKPVKFDALRESLAELL